MKRLLAGFAVLCVVTVTAVNAYSFAGGNRIDSTFCIDGVDKADLTTEQTSPPFTLMAYWGSEGPGIARFPAPPRPARLRCGGVRSPRRPQRRRESGRSRRPARRRP